MSIAERLQHTMKKMEEPKEVEVSAHSSQQQSMGTVTISETKGPQRSLAGKTSHLVSTVGGFPSSTAVHVPTLASSISSTKQIPPSEVQPVVVKSSFGQDSPSTTAHVEVHQRLDARINGPTYFTLVRSTAVGNYLPEKASASGMSTSAALAAQSQANVESLLVCDACEKGTHLKCLPASGTKTIQKSDWHCQKCLLASNGKPFPPKYGRVTRNTVAKATSGGRVSALLEKKVEEKCTLGHQLHAWRKIVGWHLLQKEHKLDVLACKKLTKIYQKLVQRNLFPNLNELWIHNLRDVCHLHLRCKDMPLHLYPMLLKDDNAPTSIEVRENQTQETNKQVADEMEDASKISETSPRQVLEEGMNCEHRSQAIYENNLGNGSDVPSYSNTLMEETHAFDWVGDILESLWEDKEKFSKLATVNQYYLPRDLQEIVSQPLTPEKHEVYASDKTITILATSICGLCDVLSEEQFRIEANRTVEDNDDGKNLIYMCRWTVDVSKGSFNLSL
ncbi:hypothetical protein HPP92_015255 [Vanilla planifolia]|uniref:BAH domain-containing protein n=1 Tax=Vanilla planifolia TaxID=51239 RepID=A0A835UTV8_VANPL|nr:hypothetical protein HPP92_015255 [Vanilla planifolia]